MSDAESADYNIEDVAEQNRIREADRIYDNLDYNIGFFSTLEKAITILEGMRDPFESKLFEKIDRISREGDHKWKRSACNQALMSIDQYRHRRIE